MPVTVTREVELRTVKAGDEIKLDTTPEDVWEIVESNDPKQKWTIIVTDLGKHRREVTEKVKIKREEQTPEERAEERKQARIWGIERSIEQAAANLVKAREKMIEEIDASYTSHWAYEAFITAKEEDALWRRVAKVWELAQKPEHAEKAIAQGEEPFESIIDAYEYIKREVMRKVLEYYTPTSRSTSIVSNVIEDIQRGAQLKFARDDRWY